jgi:hypothetical protein
MKRFGAAVAFALIVGGATIPATPAYAGAYGCTVNRYKTGGSAVANTGWAGCESLTGGTQVRVKVTCYDNAVKYGAWTSRTSPNGSTASCPVNITAKLVDFQTATPQR